MINQNTQTKELKYCQQMQYMRDFIPNPEIIKFKSLKDIKDLVEIAFNCGDISLRNNTRPYPDARKLFVKVAFKACIYHEVKIMNYIERHRSSFYPCMTQAQNLIDTSPSFNRMYNTLINKL